MIVTGCALALILAEQDPQYEEYAFNFLQHFMWIAYAMDRIGVPTSVQLQVGRDTLTAVKMAVEEVNRQGGVLGRKFEFVSADETENPETGISPQAIKEHDAIIEAFGEGNQTQAEGILSSHIYKMAGNYALWKSGRAADSAPEKRSSTSRKKGSTP